jgi:2-succinyl-6-hydroxy-2,4-cyclohexadiene-1-carboxylate synthase
MFVELHGARVHLRSVGDGQPVLLLHGFMGSIETWAPHIAVCARHGLRAIAVDLIGHGGSDAPVDPARYRMERCVEDLVDLLDILGIERAAVLGYSMGGRLALQLAASAAERVSALMLESASPGIADPAERRRRAEADELLAEALERDGLEAFVDRWAGQPLFASQATLPADVRARVRDQRLRQRPIGLANSLRGLSAGRQAPVWDRLPALHVPTLLVVGALDEKYRALGRAMAEALPRARLAVVPGAGHTVHLEQPRAFDELILGFLGADTAGTADAATTAEGTRP